jgi:hypothetical protein
MATENDSAASNDILKLYRLSALTEACIVRLLVTIPLILTLRYDITGHGVYSSKLEDLAIQLLAIHGLLVFLSVLAVPLLVYFIAKGNIRPVPSILHFLLYYCLINLGVVFIEGHYAALYSLGS